MSFEDLEGRDPKTPVDSMAMLVMPQDLIPSAKSCRSWVNVPNARTGVSQVSGWTTGICRVDPMSMAAILG